MANKGRFTQKYMGITSPGRDEEAKEIANRYRAKGYTVRIIHNIWGNTKVWVRKGS